MILEVLISFFTNFILGLLDLISLVSLPVDAVQVLQTFCVYGSYIVGRDLLMLFASLVFTWTAAKLSVGVGIRLWEMLPLT